MCLKNYPFGWFGLTLSFEFIEIFNYSSIEDSNSNMKNFQIPVTREVFFIAVTDDSTGYVKMQNSDLLCTVNINLSRAYF